MPVSSVNGSTVDLTALTFATHPEMTSRIS